MLFQGKLLEEGKETPNSTQARKDFIHCCHWSFPGMPCMDEDQPTLAEEADSGTGWKLRTLGSRKGLSLWEPGKGNQAALGMGTGISCRATPPWLLVILFTQTLVDACPLFRYALPRVGPAPCRFSSCARR